MFELFLFVGNNVAENVDRGGIVQGIGLVEIVAVGTDKFRYDRSIDASDEFVGMRPFGELGVPQEDIRVIFLSTSRRG